MFEALFLVVCNLLIFGRTLFYKYVIDDADAARCICKEAKFYTKTQVDGLVRTECLKCHLQKQEISPENLCQKIWWHLMGRQYTNSVLAHSLALSIHTLNCVLIYLVFGHNNISLLTALLFMVNPIILQGGVWLSGKPYSMMATLILAMWGLKLLAPLFYWLTYFLSVGGIFALLIFIRTGCWYWILLMPIFFYIKRRWFFSQIAYKYAQATDYQKTFKLANLILFFKTLGYYFCLCLIPTRLGVHHTYLYTYGLTKEESDNWLRLDRFFFIGVIFLIVLITNFSWNWSPVIFGLMWFFVFIAQWCNLITIQQSIAERYAYLPAIGIMYTLVNVALSLDSIGDKVLLAFFVYYITCLMVQCSAYKDLLTAAEYNILNFPDSHAGWTWKGTIEILHFRRFMAFEAWVTGWKLRPHDFRLCNNLAVLCTDMGLIEEAEKFIQIAASIPIQGREKEQAHYVNNELERIEQVKQARKKQAEKIVGRNDPCVCGSGKKYKKCCGR